MRTVIKIGMYMLERFCGELDMGGKGRERLRMTLILLALITEPLEVP